MANVATVTNETVTAQANVGDAPATTQANTGVLSGRKVIIAEVNHKALFLALLIITVGIILIAAITTTPAIAGGVTLIILGLGTFAYQIGKIAKAKAVIKNIICEALVCKEDLSDLPKLRWIHTTSNNNVEITITKDQIEAERQALLTAFIADCGNTKKLPFVVTLPKTKEQLSIYVFDTTLNDKSFSFNIDGKIINCAETHLATLRRQIKSG